MTTKTKGVFLLFKGKNKKIAPYNNDKYKTRSKNTIIKTLFFNNNN